MMPTRENVVLLARSYIGTRYHHRGRTPHLALDCGGVPICIMRTLGIVPKTFDVEPYTMLPDGKSLLAICDALADKIENFINATAGDVIVISADQHPQHVGILADHPRGGLSFIHASNDRDVQKVIETRLRFDRSNRFICAYRFRGVS